jgi:hypothetical protein
MADGPLGHLSKLPTAHQALYVRPVTQPEPSIRPVLEEGTRSRPPFLFDRRLRDRHAYILSATPLGGLADLSASFFLAESAYSC